MDLKYFQNKGEGEFEILLHGIVGEEINGPEVASEILFLNSIGAKVIKERINTLGGSVIDAFSIVSANLASNAEIHTINEGVSDSAGSFILASGNPGKRSAMDFSTMMIHNPSFNGKPIEDIEDEKLKNNLIMMRDSIVTILTNNSGKSRKEITNMMAVETRMTAKQAKEFGFIDNIQKSVKKPLIMDNMSLADIMNVCNDLNKNNLKIDNKMDDQIKNLNDKVTDLTGKLSFKDTQVEDLENKNTSLTEDVTNLNTQVSEKDNEISELKSKVEAFENKEVETAVSTAISSGKFAEESREDLTNKCKKLGVEDFTSMIDSINIPTANALDQVNNTNRPKKETDKEAEKKLAEKYQNLADNDPMELERIKNTSPKEFEEMLNAWNK